VPGKVDEAAWADAKAAAREEYPQLSTNSDRFWAIVQTIYQRMKGKTKIRKGGEAGTVTRGAQASLAARYWFQGIPISVENSRGSWRAGTDPDGHEWKVYMHHDYGYIRGTKGQDGEHLDCYVGYDMEATHAYVVHQVRPDTSEFDEDKVMLGFSSKKEAKAAYLRQYDTPKFYGGMREIPMDAFKLMLRTHRGKRLTTGPAKRFLIKAEVPEGVASTLQWEPPGGTHPQTWRAQYGDKYIYRQSKPGEELTVERGGQLYTSKEKAEIERTVAPTGIAAQLISLRDQTIEMTPAQHRKEAQKPNLTTQQRDFHQVEAQKKVDLTAFRSQIQDQVAALKQGAPSRGKPAAPVEAMTTAV
jgi:hypothetical protein